MSNMWKQFLEKEGVKHELTVPYTPEQNGVSERLNRTLLESTRAMIYGTSSPKLCWGEAVACAAYLKNRWPSAALTDMKTPEEVWSGMKPNIQHIRQFGSPCHVHIPDETRTKLEDKSWEGLLMGYSETSKAYRVWDPRRRTVVVARDVVVHEGRSPSVIMIPPVSNEGTKEQTTLTIDIPNVVVQHDEDAPHESPAPLRRSTRIRLEPERFEAHINIVPQGGCNVSEVVEPGSLKEALESTESSQWLSAVKEELDSLEEHQTWEV